MRSWRRTTIGEWFTGIPPMIRAIMVACVVIWLTQLVTRNALAGIWAQLVLLPTAVLHQGRVWQLVTYQFLHDTHGLGHILFNIFTLWMFGRDLEPRWGSGRFLAFYLTCGVGGGMAWIAMMHFTGGQPVVGASGAIMGVLTAYALIWPHRQILVMMIVPMQARHAVLVMALIELLLAWNPKSGVANFAHLGGMATAWIYLRWGGRIGSLPRAFGRKISDLRHSWRKRRMSVVEKDWDRVLEDEDDKGRRH